MTGRPLPSTAVAENTTRSLRAREGEHLPGDGGRDGGQRHDKRRLLQQASECTLENPSIAARRGRIVIRLTFLQKLRK